jgi:hypothetical protein
MFWLVILLALFVAVGVTLARGLERWRGRRRLVMDDLEFLPRVLE